MKWASSQVRRAQEYERLKEWHLWYAWRPVCIGGYWYWLTFVGRRADPIHWKQRKEIRYWYRVEWV